MGHIRFKPATVGTEKTTNGTFTGSATGWTLSGGPTYNSNGIVYAGAGFISQTPPLVDGTSYKVEMIISGYVSGDLEVFTESGGSGWGSAGGNGTTVVYITAGATGDIRFTSNAFNGKLDSVSVKPLSHAVGDAINSIAGLTNTDYIVRLKIGGSVGTVNVALSD